MPGKPLGVFLESTFPLCCERHLSFWGNIILCFSPFVLKPQEDLHREHHERERLEAFLSHSLLSEGISFASFTFKLPVHSNLSYLILRKTSTALSIDGPSTNPLSVTIMTCLRPGIQRKEVCLASVLKVKGHVAGLDLALLRRYTKST